LAERCSVEEGKKIALIFRQVGISKINSDQHEKNSSHEKNDQVNFEISEYRITAPPVLRQKS